LLADMARQLEEGDVLRVRLRADLPLLVEIARVMTRCINSDGVIYFCGNGGSAADSQHIAAEFVVRLSSARDRRSLPALALTTDTSVLTAAANDFGYERVFARQVEALGNPGDILVGLSTSGRSANVLEALKVARSKGMITVGFTGGDGGDMVHLCDYVYVVESGDTCRIQEIHEVVGHLIVGLVEKMVP